MRDTRTWFPLTPRPDEPSAASLFPANPDRTTLHRWAKHGLYGIKLRLTHSGGRTGVLVEDAIAFDAAVNQHKRAGQETVEDHKRRSKKRREISRVMQAMGM